MSVKKYFELKEDPNGFKEGGNQINPDMLSIIKLEEDDSGTHLIIDASSWVNGPDKFTGMFMTKELAKKHHCQRFTFYGRKCFK